MSELPGEREFQPAAVQTINEVDGLLERIEEIQNTCEHSFTLTEPFQMRQSCVPAVLMAHNALLNYHPTFTIKCVKCSCLRHDVSPTMLCPVCFVKMIESDTLASRERYFGSHYQCYGVRIHSCPKCFLNVAADEWDQ